MIPIVLPETSPCDEPPPNCGLATHEPARNVVTASNSRWVRTSIVIMTYSAIAGSWPKTLQIVTPFGTAVVSSRSSPAATDCSRRRRGAGGKSARQIWPTTISASVSNGAACTASASSSRIEVSKGVVTLARIRGATVAAKWPRNRALIRCSNLQTTVEGLSPFNHYSRQANGDFLQPPFLAQEGKMRCPSRRESFIAARTEIVGFYAGTPRPSEYSSG